MQFDQFRQIMHTKSKIKHCNIHTIKNLGVFIEPYLTKQLLHRNKKITFWINF
jgi:hypothetical protein